MLPRFFTSLRSVLNDKTQGGEILFFLINAKIRNRHFTFPLSQVLRDKDQKQDDDE